MAINNPLHPRQPHSARWRRLQGLNSGDGSNLAGALGVRQFGHGHELGHGIPTDIGFTLPFSDAFPPTIPTAAPNPPPPADTVLSTPTTDIVPPSSTTTSTPITTPATPNVQTVSTTQTAAPPPVATLTPTSISNQPTLQTQLDDTTVTITSSITRSSASATADSALNTSLSSSDSSTSTGPIIGGIVAGIIALTVLILAVVWFVRRRKRGSLDDPAFDVIDFRRSAILLNDHRNGIEDSDSLGRGPSFNSNGHFAHAKNSTSPRPPTMIERKLTHGPIPALPAHQGGYSPSEMFSSAAYASTQGHGQYGHSINHQNFEGEAFYNQSYQRQNQYPQPYRQPYHHHDQHISHLPAQPVDQNVNPFMAFVQPYSPQLQSPFSPPIPQEPSGSEVTTLNSANVAVLAHLAGTRSVSPKPGRSGKSGKLSISIPKVAVNATVINDSVVSDVEVKEGSIEHSAFKRQESASSLTSGTSRSGSVRRNESVKTMPQPPLATRDSIALPTGDYVDLARSSVSPFQAAQYAEISKKLNSEVPKGLSMGAIEEFVKARDRDLPPLPSPSPMPAAIYQDEQGQHSPFADHHQTNPRNSVVSRISSDNHEVRERDLFDFPNPPPGMAFPSHTHSDSASSSILEFPPALGSSKSRIDSFPPQLPEIKLELSSRMSMDSKFDKHESFLPAPGMVLSMGLRSAKDSPVYPSGITAGGSPLLGRFPVTPSPLGASFVIDTPNAGSGHGQGVFGRQQQQQQHHGAGVLIQDHPTEEHEVKEVVKINRPTTVYDLEDVYGGI